MSVKQHPMDVAKGDTTKQRDLIIVKPIVHDQDGNERPLSVFPGKTKSGDDYRVGRVQIYDATTGQALNYMTGTNADGKSIGTKGKIVGSQQTKPLLEAFNQLLEGPDAIIYHSSSKPNGAGTRAVGIKADVDISDNRSGAHVINKIPEGGFQSFAVTPEQVHNAFSSSAKFQIVNAFAGRAYDEAVKAGKSPEEAKAISQVAQASDAVRHGVPYINAPAANQQVQDILSGKTKPVPVEVSVPSIAAKRAADASAEQTPTEQAPTEQAPTATPLPTALPAPDGPGVEDDGFEM